MKDILTVAHHSISEQLVQILCEKTQNSNPMFFRILVAYYLTKIPSMMRVKILTKDRGIIPINIYAINLATSGHGKGYSSTVLAEEVIDTFKTVFFDQTFPVVTEENIAALAIKRANIKDTDPDQELLVVQKEFKDLGPLLFAFDSATPAAIKQAHIKLLMGEIGSLNLEMDEVGNNLTSNADVLGTMLELFDVGKVKQKLTKNTRESQRVEDIDGRVPANMILFGTPSKVFDGAKVEEEFWSFLETGYARRCFFGYTRVANRNLDMSPQEIYDLLIDTSKNQYIKDISVHLGQLANPVNYNKILTVNKDVSLLLIEYKLHCERLSKELGEYQEVKRSELSHRYFKALKLAGTYAFIDGNDEITEDNLYSAIKLAEESGEAFTKLLNRDRNYVKLAKFIAQSPNEVTHVDLTEDLPFYKGPAAQKADMLQLAIAYGYKHKIIIKRSVSNGVEFLSGETLQPTDINSISISVSDDITVNYKNMNVSFDKLYRLAQKDDLHWVAHHLKDGYRSEDHIIPGFNLIVLDVDGGPTINEVKLLLKDYKALIYTTKRHNQTSHRFRVVLPTNFQLKLDTEEYKEFMRNVYEWIPFKVDTGTVDIARKWLTHNGHYEYINGDNLLDVMEFIPRTTKNDERKKGLLTTQSLSNLERWFVNNTVNGNRSNQLVKYGLVLVDSNKNFSSIRDAVIELNNKLPDKLSEREIDTTIMVTITKALANKGKV